MSDAFDMGKKERYRKEVSRIWQETMKNFAESDISLDKKYCLCRDAFYAIMWKTNVPLLVHFRELFCYFRK